MTFDAETFERLCKMLSVGLDISFPTARRWIDGKTKPHSVMFRPVLLFLLEAYEKQREALLEQEIELAGLGALEMSHEGAVVRLQKENEHLNKLLIDFGANIAALTMENERCRGENISIAKQRDEACEEIKKLKGEDNG